MKVTLPYRNEPAEFNTEEICQVIDSPDFEIGLADEIISNALASPIDSQSFLSFIKDSKSVLFVINDGTRPTPTALVLEHVYNDIKDHPDIKFIIATGTHRAPTEDELSRIFGKHLEEFRTNILVHDSRNKDEMVYMGKTERGTPVSFDIAVIEADGIVAINSVEPHYFAGFTGGRKSFLPGISAFETVERNHSYTDRDGSAPLALAGNPVSEDMFEAAAMLGDKRIFSIQTVMTGDHKLYGTTMGDLTQSFLAAVDMAKELYAVKIEKQANIVITVAPPPMDSSIYQAQKALENARSAIEPGGIIILVASCWDGIGARTFYEMLENFKPGDDISIYTGDNYKLGNHKAVRMLSLAQHANIWAVTDLDQETLNPARITKKQNLQSAVDEAILITKQAGKTPNIIVLPSGSLIVPQVSQ